MEDSTNKPSDELEESPTDAKEQEIASDDEIRRRRRQRGYQILLEAEQHKVIEVPGDIIM
jgi:hypothetical protein